MAVALTFRGEDMSYAELNRRANRVANRLRAMGVGPETLVGLAIGRSLEMIIGLLAIVKAGGAYVPLDLSYPRARLNFMLRDTHPDLLLTGGQKLDVEAPWAKVLQLTADAAGFATESEEDLGVLVEPHNVAYVMYTSGSTGNPKGVVIEQRSIFRLVCDPGYITISPLDTFLQLAPISFDASTLEIWGALLNGSRLVIMEPGTPNLGDIARVIEREQVTTLWLTAGLFHAMVDEHLPSLATVRNMLAGGDIVSAPHVEKFLDAHRSSIFINGYGPTEGTTFTCCHALQFGNPIGKTIPIGVPIAKTRVLILDEALEQVPVGQPGELFIGGEGVARGYLNLPELTAQRFVKNPYATDPADVMYRSGDLVSIRYDGVIEFLGRQDNQVKVRGYRVELGEIEVCLQQHPAVRHAVAIALENDRAEKAIHTFWTAKAGAIAESDELLQFAGQRLPSFMMPASLTHVDSLPLTANGKVDRTQLLAMAMREISRKDSYVPPSDVLEVELIGIWEEVLRTKRVGIRDDFFTLGGHSLLAARMFTRIEERLRKTIPLATIFAAPTIEKLAQVIRTEGWTSHWSVLVPIQQGGSRPPLFLMHGLHGNVLTYYGLRHHMPPDQPVYGVQAEGLHSGRASFVSLPEMAEYYIREIRSVQPSGPYFIGGFSGGGLLAYEMAQQLSAAGERIQFLALFDSYVEVAGGYWLKSFSSRRALRMSLLALRANWQMTRKHGLSYVVGWKAKNANINLRIMLWQLTGKLFAKTRSGRHLRASLLNPAAAFTYAIRVYVPKPYSGPAVLFRAPSSGFENSGLSEGWKNYITGNLEIQVIEGLHQDIFREPHIGRLAEQLTQTLESAQADQNDAGKTK